MLPYPIVTDATVVLAMNPMGMEGQHQTSVAVLDRATGRQLATSDKGGIGTRWARYVQHGNVVVMTDWMLKAYKLEP